MRVFENQSPVPADHPAFYRIRTNFAIVYAAAALAIDYTILPWKKKPTLQAIRKCMNLAFDVLNAHGGALSSITQIDPSDLAAELARRMSGCKKCKIVKIARDDGEALRARRRAECLIIQSKLYIKSKVMKAWFPEAKKRAAMKKASLFSSTNRKDTPTVEKKVIGINGKPRYYQIDRVALKRLCAS